MASWEEFVQATARRLGVVHTRGRVGGYEGQVGQHFSDVPCYAEGLLILANLVAWAPNIFEKFCELGLLGY